MFSNVICRQLGDKWQSKTLFLNIFDLRSSILLTFSIAIYPVWECHSNIWDTCCVLCLGPTCAVFILTMQSAEKYKCYHMLVTIRFKRAWSIIQVVDFCCCCFARVFTYVHFCVCERRRCWRNCVLAESQSKLMKRMFRTFLGEYQIYLSKCFEIIQVFTCVALAKAGLVVGPLRPSVRLSVRSSVRNNLGCLVCVICNSKSFPSFIFKLCQMIVHTLKMCTSYFVHIW